MSSPWPCLNSYAFLSAVKTFLTTESHNHRVIACLCQLRDTFPIFVSEILLDTALPCPERDRSVLPYQIGLGKLSALALWGKGFQIGKAVDFTACNLIVLRECVYKEVGSRLVRCLLLVVKYLVNMHSSSVLFAAFLSTVCAYDTQLAFNAGSSTSVEVENRTLDDIYQAALAEGDTITLWHGGDEKNQQDALKKAFETRFPKLTLNVTVDVSKYHDGKIDQQLATGDLYVDSIILQTLHDYPRWDEEGALLRYKPLGFDKIYDAFKDVNGAYYGIGVFSWSNVWNTKRIQAEDAPNEFTDYLKPAFKDKLVLTYPNDDDAVLFAFDLM